MGLAWRLAGRGEGRPADPPLWGQQRLSKFGVDLLMTTRDKELMCKLPEIHLTAVKLISVSPRTSALIICLGVRAEAREMPRRLFVMVAGIHLKGTWRVLGRVR